MLTDNEIIKALEYCYGHNVGDAPCGDCPRFNHPDGCVHARDALDIINRQKAEIERLNNHILDVTKMVKAEAVKEFAERLKTRCYPWETYGHFHSLVTSEECIDNLVKEMVGEDNG